MNAFEKTVTNLHGKLFAQHLIISFLLAREAVAHGGLPMLKNVHSSLTQEVSGACQVRDATGVVGNFEAAASVELDELFLMASGLYGCCTRAAPPGG